MVTGVHQGTNTKAYELLAPAGNVEALQAAVQNGADAVYLSGKNFGARKFANNFSDDELIEAVNYCHIRDVAVYVTVNTLVFNHEFDQLKTYLDFLYTNGVDAVIVQDIGVLDYIRKTYADWDIHCSTQMSVQTVADIKYLESLGAKRVVLGREMTIDDIKRAKKETSIELEVFIHGALCISVSGQCLMSSMIGGRSGNRGSCAQPCRQKYSLYHTGKSEKCESAAGDYLLSPKDLCTLDSIAAIVEAGAFSLKIEGRMKSAEYVATVVRAYRLMIEGLYNSSPVDIKALERELRIFNRGFTKGHLFNERGATLMSMNSPGNQGYLLGKVVNYDKKSRKVTIALSAAIHQNDEIQIRRKDEIVGGRVEVLEHRGQAVKTCRQGQICTVNFKHACKEGEELYKTYDAEFMKRARQTYDKEALEIPVAIKAVIKRGAAMTGSISDGRFTVLEKTGILPQDARNRSLTVEEISTQLVKLGGTPYHAESIEVTLDEGLSVSIKDINSLRRALVLQLNQKRAGRFNRQPKLSTEARQDAGKMTPQQIELTFSAANLTQLKALLTLGAANIYYKDLQTLGAAVEIAREANFTGKIIPEIFRLASDADLRQYRDLISRLQIDTVLIQSYGHIHTFSGLTIIGDVNLNVVNDFSYEHFRNSNFARITLSPELNLSQISALDVVPATTEMIGYGYLPVMVMKHCVISAALNRQKNCELCSRDSYCLTDKMNENFKITKRYQCNTEIYNSKKLLLLEHSKTLESKGVGFFRLNFLDESPEDVAAVVEVHRSFISGKATAADVERINALKKDGVTGGHLHRGVE